MMNNKHFKTFLFSFLLILIGETMAQRITELINPFKATEGVWNTILVSDLFFDENYNISVTPNDEFETEYNQTTHELKFRTTDKFIGLSLLQIRNNSRIFDLIITGDKKQKVLFDIVVSGDAKKVNLFGSFNGWNRESIFLNKKDKNIFETEILLEPGNYEYKFIVDGIEHLDDDNPRQVPNGLGGINSLLSVEAGSDDKLYLHQNGYDTKDDKLNLNFFLETESTEKYSSENYLVLVDNEQSDVKFNHVGRNMTFQFSSAQLRNKDFIRIVMRKGKNISNIQTIFLENGIPVQSTSEKYWHSKILYSLMIDRFKDGDQNNNSKAEHPEILPQANYYGGDLAGLYDKIISGYFDSLSVSALWISPVIDNTNLAYKEYPAPNRYYSGYHGYWPIHPRAVEEKFGSMELLQKLIAEAHKRKIKVLLDFVANHVHDEHPYWKEHRDWFGTLELPDGRRNLRLWDEQRLTTWFEPFMPSFDYQGSNDALEQMTDDAVWWLKTSGADGYRHDAVKHVPNEFWRLLTKKLNQRFPEKKMYQIGETFGSYELVSSYVNNGQLDAQFNFNLYDAMLVTFADSNSSFTYLNEQLQKTFDVYGVNNMMGNVIDSHDKVRFMAYADGDITMTTSNAIEIGWNNPPIVDDPLSYKKQLLALAYLMTIPGLPVIYYGDEIGMTGAADPDNRRMMLFDHQLDEHQRNTLAHTKKLSAIRKSSSALLYGDFYPLNVDKNIFAFIRTDMNETVLVVLNKGSFSQTVSVALPVSMSKNNFTDLLNNSEYRIENGKVDLNVAAFDFKILKFKR